MAITKPLDAKHRVLADYLVVVVVATRHLMSVAAVAGAEQVVPWHIATILL